MGISMAKKGDLEGAIVAFEKAISLQPTNASFKSNLQFALQLRAKRDARPTAPPPREVKRP
jgi:Flp pilus assembly protein TadD